MTRKEKLYGIKHTCGWFRNQEDIEKTLLFPETCEELRALLAVAGVSVEKHMYADRRTGLMFTILESGKQRTLSYDDRFWDEEWVLLAVILYAVMEDLEAFG